MSRITTEVLITGRTLMKENVRCIGGLDLIHKKSIRLLNPDGTNYNITDSEFRKAPFMVGKVFRIEYAPSADAKAPHTEDVWVYHAHDLRDESDVRGVVENLGVRVYKNVSIREIFGGKLKFNPGGSAYVSPSDPSDHSTCFWVSNAPMVPVIYESGRRMLCDGISIKSVCEAPVEKLPPGTLVRFSLSRLFEPTTSPAGYYLQLSGWF